MTTTTEERLREHLQRLAEGPSGLPLFDDLKEFRQLLGDAEERLGSFASAAVAVGNAYGDEVPIPFPIEVEHLAVLGLVVQDVKYAIGEFDRLADKLASSLYAIDGARGAQEGSDA